MTSQERDVLGRIEGKIDRMDERLRVVEQHMAADLARREGRDAFVMSRRWVLGLVATAVISTAGLLVSVTRILTP